MPIQHEIDRERCLIRTACSGAVSLDEVLQHFRALEAERNLPDPLDVLLDLSAIETVPESDQILRIAAEIGRLLGKVRWGLCAIVATRDLVFGVSRVLEARSEEFFAASQVFRDPAAAEDWLVSERSLRSRSS
ncbi:MAG TPA: hypothetical protein VII72_20170 [Myxococcota bacterium]|jgi:hypothetical protein